MNFTPNGSPLQARQNAPVLAIIIFILLVIAFVFLIWLVSKKITEYLNSPEYEEKQRTRPTTPKDIKRISEDNKIPAEQADLLFEICKKYKLPNFNYILKDNPKINEIFKKAYFDYRDEGISEEKLNLLFKLLFSLELICAQSKKFLSTRQIPLETILFYIAESGEQYPFTLVSNNKDFFALEIPKFFFNLKTKPEVLQKLRFTFKSSNGLSHSFASRLMRYQKTEDDKVYMNIAHSEQLITESQRHFKREMFDEDCFFYPVKALIDDKDLEPTFVISEKQYEGRLSNISGGGCCIKSKLPIMEKQHLAVVFPNITGDIKTIGIIKGTRKLPDQRFALHIQFLNISIECQNRILAYVYKYHL